MHAQTAPAISLPRSLRPRRAELIFTGVDQAGPSFEGRVYLNAPAADERTPLAPEAGYAGSFHVFGFGAVAPPAMAEARRASGDEPVAPIEKRLHVDEAALGIALEHADELTITVVAVPVDPGGPTPSRPFEQVEAIFEPSATGT